MPNPITPADMELYKQRAADLETKRQQEEQQRQRQEVENRRIIEQTQREYSAEKQRREQEILKNQPPPQDMSARDRFLYGAETGQSFSSSGISTFQPPATWQVWRLNAQGQPSMYIDKDDNLYFAPGDFMYQAGWRKAGKLVKDGKGGQSILLDPKVQKYGFSITSAAGESPFAGLTVGRYTVTKKQAAELNRLVKAKDWEGLFQYQKKLGIINPEALSPDERERLQIKFNAYYVGSGQYNWALLVADLAGGKTNISYSDVAKFFGKDTQSNLTEAVRGYKRLAQETRQQIAEIQRKNLVAYEGRRNITREPTADEIFRQLQRSGEVPQNATYIGEDSEGNIRYSVPAEYAVAIEPTRAIQVNGDEFARRVAKTMMDRPHLDQLQAESIVRIEMQAENKGYIEYRGDAAADINYVIIKKTADELRQEWKEFGKDLPGLIIPGYDTVRNWGTMTNGERALSIGLDVATAALILWGGKILGGGAKIIKQPKLVKLARIAGTEGNSLRTATAEYEAVLVSGRASPSRLVQLANRVEMAQRNSIKADRLLLEHLEKVRAVSPGTLGKIEKLSGIKDFKKVITNVNKAVRDVDKAWVKVEKNKPFTTGGDNTKHIKALDNLAGKQAELEKALNDAGSVLKPRYTPKPPAPEFKGFSTSFKDTKFRQSNLDDLQKWLDETVARMKSPAGSRRVAVIERTQVKEVKGKYELKMKPEYTEPKAVGKTKVKVPKVKSEAKTLVPRGKTATVTQGDIASYYETQSAPDVRSRVIEETLIQTAPFQGTTASEWTQVRKAIQEATKQLTAVKVSGMTNADIGLKVNSIIDANTRDVTEVRPGAKTETKPLTQTQVKTLTKTATDVITGKAEPVKVKSKPLLLTGGEGQQSKKRKEIKEGYGGFFYTRGKLEAPVHHVWFVNKSGALQREIIQGAPPEGVSLITGKGSARTSLRKIGKAKKLKPFNILEDTGAVDTVITSDGKNLSINFISDTARANISERKGRVSRGMPRISPGLGRISGRFPKLR